MCREINPKSRRLFAIASVCVTVGLLLPMLFHPSAPSARSVLHFVCGNLIGVSGSINLSVAWKSFRRRLYGDR